MYMYVHQLNIQQDASLWWYRLDTDPEVKRFYTLTTSGYCHLF